MEWPPVTPRRPGCSRKWQREQIQDGLGDQNGVVSGHAGDNGAVDPGAAGAEERDDGHQGGGEIILGQGTAVRKEPGHQFLHSDGALRDAVAQMDGQPQGAAYNKGKITAGIFCISTMVLMPMPMEQQPKTILMRDLKSSFKRLPAVTPKRPPTTKESALMITPIGIDILSFSLALEQKSFPINNHSLYHTSGSMHMLLMTSMAIKAGEREEPGEKLVKRGGKRLQGMGGHSKMESENFAGGMGQKDRIGPDRDRHERREGAWRTC